VNPGVPKGLAGISRLCYKKEKGLGERPGKEKAMVGVIVVDVQGDFTQLMDGSLAVPGTGLEYLNKVTKAVEEIKKAGIPLWASQDWHPADHVSFYTNHPGKKVYEKVILDGREQVLWPPHCVQGTAGAELLLDPSLFQAVIRKGTDPRFDSYSCFQDDGGRETELHLLLKEEGIQGLVLFGIATDYCVRYSALDGLARGYQVTVVHSLCRGVDSESSDKALREIRLKGGKVFEGLEEALTRA
jgi:nicotinamidase/pyrazinamidase